jgi:hypothetical protein
VGLDPGAARERVRVARALGTLPALAEALACGQLSYAKVRALTRVATPEAGARLLAVGRAGTAAPTRAQQQADALALLAEAAVRRALQHRDRGCRFPGCGLRIGEGHHVRHWVQGGPTTLENLALLCRRHHRAVHQEGYRLERLVEGALRLRRPDGRALPEVPPPAAVPADPVGAIRARHTSQGLRIDARSGCPGWLGERLDVAWAIDVPHPRAATGPGRA